MNSVYYFAHKDNSITTTRARGFDSFLAPPQQGVQIRSARSPKLFLNKLI